MERSRRAQGRSSEHPLLPIQLWSAQSELGGSLGGWMAGQSLRLMLERCPGRVRDLVCPSGFSREMEPIGQIGLWGLAHMVMEAEKSHLCHCKLETQEADGIIQSKSEGLRARQGSCWCNSQLSSVTQSCPTL